MTPAVEVRGLTKIFEPAPGWLRLLVRTQIRTPVTALDDVTLSLDEGQICAVVGPNGAGKSTLFRILTGLTSATSGSAEVMGIDVTTPTTAIRRLVGYMPADDRSLFLRQTCRENLDFHARLRGIGRTERVARIDEVLDMVGLAHAAGRAGFALSSGMRARLMFARALLHRPKVLILDEPTATTDPVASFELLEIIKRAAREERAAVLISSHRLEEIEALRESVMMLHDGRVAYQGDVDALRATWTLPTLDVTFTSTRAAADAAAILRARPEVEDLTIDGPVVQIRTPATAGTLLGHLNGQVAAIVSVTQETVPLRELLAAMVAGSGGRRA